MPSLLYNGAYFLSDMLWLNLLSLQLSTYFRPLPGLPKFITVVADQVIILAASLTHKRQQTEFSICLCQSPVDSSQRPSGESCSFHNWGNPFSPVKSSWEVSSPSAACHCGDSTYHNRFPLCILFMPVCPFTRLGILKIGDDITSVCLLDRVDAQTEELRSEKRKT